ncbi:hypothetical protein Tco_1393598 [Tanacetum coccineum]
MADFLCRRIRVGLIALLLYNWMDHDVKVKKANDMQQDLNEEFEKIATRHMNGARSWNFKEKLSITSVKRLHLEEPSFRKLKPTEISSDDAVASQVLAAGTQDPELSIHTKLTSDSESDSNLLPVGLPIAAIGKFYLAPLGDGLILFGWEILRCCLIPWKVVPVIPFREVNRIGKSEAGVSIPSGRILIVPAGRYVVPAGRVIISFLLLVQLGSHADNVVHNAVS